NYPVEVKLSTVHGEELIQCRKASGLMVMGTKESIGIPLPGQLIGVEYLLKQTGQTLQGMMPDSEAPDIDDVGATDERFEDRSQENTPDHTIGSLMVSDPLWMSGTRAPKHQDVTSHFSFVIIVN
ncbi:hypothetical protein LSH36_431g02002, partial [Paralvinella palmiformis]